MSLPPVHIKIQHCWVDFLLDRLQNEEEKHHKFREQNQYLGEKLVDQIISNGKPFVDKNGSLCFDLGIYPGEAANFLWLLLMIFGLETMPDEEYNVELSAKILKGGALYGEKV